MMVRKKRDVINNKTGRKTNLKRQKSNIAKSTSTCDWSLGGFHDGGEKKRVVEEDISCSCF